MDLLPAIDIRFGRAVRLARRDAREVTPYEDDPVALAERFVHQGAKWLHITDLDRAFGDGDNADLIGRIIRRVGSYVRIQLGGGLRTVERLRSVAGLEVARFVVRSTVQGQPEFLPEVVTVLGADRVVAGIEARNGLVVLHGWQQSTTIFARDVALRVAQEGVRTILYTDMAREGMLNGLDLVGGVALHEVSGAEILLCGGAGSLDDLIRAKAALVAGVVIGRALYEPRFTLREAFTALLDA